MAYDYFGVTDIANVSEAVIGSIVQEELVEYQRLLPTCSDYSSLVVPGAASISVPKGSSLTAAPKVEGTEFTALDFTYGVDTLSFSHYVVPVDIEDIAKLQSKVALMQDLTGRMGNALADSVDTLIYTQLQECSSSTPDHQIQYNDTTNEDLEITDILEANRLLNVQKVSKSDRFMLIHPGQEKNLLLIDSFVEADKYGSRDALLNGEIGRVFGFRIIVSSVENIATDAYTILFHKSHCAWAWQQGVKVEVNRNGKNLSDIVAAHYIGGAKVLDGGKRGVRFEETA